MPRGNCKATYSWRSRRRRPSRSCRENFRNCRRIPWWPERNSHPTGITASLPERGSVPSEPAGTLQQLPGRGPASPMRLAHNPPTQRLTSVLLLLPCRLRKRIEELTLELSETRRKLELSEKEKRQLQKTMAEQDMKMADLLDRIKLLQHQV